MAGRLRESGIFTTNEAGRLQNSSSSSAFKEHALLTLGKEFAVAVIGDRPYLPRPPILSFPIFRQNPRAPSGVTRRRLRVRKSAVDDAATTRRS